MNYPEHLQRLIQILQKLPGVGSKSAERFAFHMLDWEEKDLHLMGDIVTTLSDKIQCCSECGCLMSKERCLFCLDPTRNQKILCIVATPKDVYSIEQTHEFQGIYHVLGGLLSPLDGIGPENLQLSAFLERLKTHEVSEVIIAIDSTLEGDATSLYIRQLLASTPLKLTRLAFGVPMGSSLDYVDGGTLARAFSARGQYSV